MSANRSGISRLIVLACIGGLALGAALFFLVILPSWPRRPPNSGTRGQMGSLSVAIRQYREIFYTFPPSNPSLVAACGDGKVGTGHAASGAESLNFFLRGWYVTEDGTVVRGQGVRVSALGGMTKTVQPMYAPARGEENKANDSRYGFGGAANGLFFGDGFSHRRPILYFKAAIDGGSQPFTESDNALPLAKWKAPNAKSFSSFVKPDGVTPRSVEFLLWSAGPDGYFLSEDDIIYP